MKKIGIDARMMGKSQASGIGNYIQQIVSRIVLLDKDNQYFIFVKPENQNVLDLNLPNVTKVVIDCHWYSLCEQIKFLRLLNSLKLDLVHFPQFNVPLLYRKPMIVTIHDVTPLIFPGHKRSSKLRDWAFKMVFKRAIKAAQIILTVSDYTKGEISRFFKVNADKIVVAKLGIENDFKGGQNYAKIKEIIARLNVTKPYLFFISAWRSHKNFEGLIRAFAILKNEYHQDWQLVLGGKEDPQYPAIRNLIMAQDEKVRADIITPGFISEEDLPAVYQGSLAFVLPSFLEGFGLIGLEAMASSAPVICANTGSLPEIYGNAAVYFNPAHPEEMALKILQTVTNENTRATLVNKGLARLQLYNWDDTASQTLSAYRKILGL